MGHQSSGNNLQKLARSDFCEKTDFFDGEVLAVGLGEGVPLFEEPVAVGVFVGSEGFEAGFDAAIGRFEEVGDARNALQGVFGEAVALARGFDLVPGILSAA
jgi:hypothetical protein